ncbi:protein transport protein [Grosmannia clavigera kw1407]|uniref:Protein transport protein SEC31 n=1 Tax=Grosmannia clavigera (strain kw1407 / UAMH 11150) TaxID=655863 RepID=F0X7Z1_GROCL|nr:protein transport protein [Grosmannia clavigera kw1407]EFX06673.1 protein transport protein [Grosmannia clavigera kw1407]
MVQLREIPRTAVFAWSPGTDKPFLVTGTRAGAVDADFSDETKLELWDLSLDSKDGVELQPVHSISTDSRFYDIAWGPPDEDYPRGVIAGALESGALELYDAEKLALGASDALIDSTTRHSGAIKTLQFNPMRPQILATGGAKGELFIYNIGDLQNPFRLGNAAASRADDIEALAWNKKVSHILATGGSGGQVTVWDVKTKKASLTLNNNRKAVSAIAWDPTNSTKLITASPDDNAPVIYLWNLRNSNAPEKTLSGHEAGVLSLSWCQQDPDILLSCGKDNRTLVWNPQTGESYGELQQGTNWAFLTRFNPENPNLTATASFDGKITVQTLQNTNNTADAQAAAQSNLDGEDFFASAHTAPQVASFSLPKPPAWYLKPVGATFGFGGKVVYFTLNDTPAGQPASSTVHIGHFSADAKVAPTTEKFEEALQSGDVKAICASHIETAKTDEEKADWEVLGTLVDANPRQRVIERLGFDKDEATEEDTNGVVTEEKKAQEEEKEEDSLASTDGKKTDKDQLSSFFDDKGDTGGDEDDFLAGLSAAKDEKDAKDEKKTKTNGPFHLLGSGNTALEDTITKAVMLGKFGRAVDICLKENRIADAFVIANCGGKELVQKVQAAYLAETQGTPSYLRLLNSVIAEDLRDVVQQADLANWKEALVTLCTFAKPEEFPKFCEGLGDRILEAGSRKDASFCYLVGSRLEKVVQIWISELDEAEKAGVQADATDSSYSVHAKSLQQFIEKVTVFRHVTKFEDGEASLTSGWKLAALYDKYIEFADIVAATGLMSVAQKYLNLVPTTYEAAEVARNRVQLALQKTTAVPQHRAATAAGQSRVPKSRTPAQPQAVLNSGSPVMAAMPRPAAMSVSSATNPYAPPHVTSAAPVNPYAPHVTPAAPANPYAPPGVGGRTSNSPYAPPYGQPQQTSAYAPPTGPYGAPVTTPAYGAPPRNSTTSAPPPSRTVDAGSWNDVPMVTRPPVRRATPNMAPITAPFGAQQTAVGPPPAGLYSPSGPRGTATPPPPPKGSAPPRVTSPLAGPPHNSAAAVLSPPPRPTSSAANTYAPPPPAVGSNTPAAMVRPPPRTESPYNQPPPGPAPTNRYAPVAAVQQASSAGPPIGFAPPPSAAATHGRYAPAPSPYEMTPGHIGQPLHQQHQQHQQQQSMPPMVPAGPPRASPAGSAMATSPPPSQAPSQPTPPPVRKTRYPAGDRSHIPPHAQRLVQILDADLQRVAAKAPPAFAAQVKDTNKRLNLLFDHLNNAELIKEDTVHQLHQLAESLEDKAFDAAQRVQVEIHRAKPEECGNWMVGVKRLIAMSKATP